MFDPNATQTPTVTNDPITGASSVAQPKNGSTLGKDDFLKLLIGQMQNQDPMNPTDSSQFMQQMTQFSILEQITNVAQTTNAAASNQYDAQAVALVGKTVTYLDAQGNIGSGVVSKVTFTSGGPQLTVGDTPGIPPVFVTEVQ